VLEYQHKLKAKAAPKPVADGKAVREALAAGRRVKAMQLVRESLAKVPGDPELTSLQSEITTYAPVIPALADAVVPDVDVGQYLHKVRRVEQLDLAAAASGSARAASGSPTLFGLPN
jgi:hypothetical protein